MANIDLTQDKIINPYDDIAVAVLDDSKDTAYASQYLTDVRSLQVGYGSKVLRADSQGIWLGAELFDDAPFSVDMDGNITATGISLSSLSGTLDDIANGTTYAKTTLNAALGAGYAYSGLNTSGEIIKGFLNTQLSSKSLPANGVRVDSNGIYGRKSSSTTFYISNSGDAYFSGDIYASNITGSTITGSTIKTASSGLQVIIAPSNPSGDSVGFGRDSNIYAEIVPSYSAQGFNLTTKVGDVQMYMSENNFGNEITLDNSNGAIISMYIGDISITADSLSLNGDSIVSWSDIGDYISFGSSSISPSAINASNYTLNVRRVTTGGVDSGWYALSFTHGVLTSATVN